MRKNQAEMTKNQAEVPKVERKWWENTILKYDVKNPTFEEINHFNILANWGIHFGLLRLTCKLFFCCQPFSVIFLGFISKLLQTLSLSNFATNLIVLF